MGCDYYSVLYKDIVLAKHMTLDNAVLFVKALFLEYCAETDSAYTIRKEEAKE